MQGARQVTLSRLMLCTDLDRTLIPNGPQPESSQARGYLQSLVSRPEVTLVFVSGRDRALVEQAMTSYQLPCPDFVIGDVGTSIYRVGPEHEWSPLGSWERHIAVDWGGKTAADLQIMLNDIEALRPQESSKQNRFKLSYYLAIECDTDGLSSIIHQRLESAGVQARLVWSVDEVENTGLLDVLPLRASKLHAIEALMEQQGFDLDSTVFCGDSGNDMEVLISPVPAVLVANAHEDIRCRAIKLAQEAGTEKQLYTASGGVLEMNGNYGAGMLEGIAHYYPETLTWIAQTADASNRIAL